MLKKKRICEIFRNSGIITIFDLLNISYIKIYIMKKIIFITSLLGCFSLPHVAFAQEDLDKKIKEKDEKKMEIDRKIKEIDEKKQSQEIIIRKKGEKDAKITVEINGDKVTINGKPLSEFKDDNITVNKRKITIWDKYGAKHFDFNMDANSGDFMNNFNWNSEGKDEPHAFLGVTTDETDGGAKISEVTKESAAEKAGLKAGDVITKINDKKIDGPDLLSEVVRTFKPKEEVTVYYKRDGKESSAKTTLGESKDANVMAYSYSGPRGIPRAFTVPGIPRVPGMNVMPKIEMWDNKDGENNFEVFGNSFPRHQKLGLKIQDTEDGTGVKVLDVDKDSPAEKAGLKKDDIVTEVGGNKINNTDEARTRLMENMAKSAYAIKAKRNGTEMNFDIKIPKKLKTANL